MEDLSEMANWRIELAKVVCDRIKGELERDEEEWHLFMMKEDKHNPDPDRFHVYTTKKKKFFSSRETITPSRHCFDIYVREDKECVVVINQKNVNMIRKNIPLPRYIQQKQYKRLDITGWILKIQ
jgi:hypothetical protein